MITDIKQEIPGCSRGVTQPKASASARYTLTLARVRATDGLNFASMERAKKRNFTA